MSANFRPTIAITMGDPAGVGPEVISKAFASNDTGEFFRLMLCLI